MVFKSDKQRKAVMAKLTAGTRADVSPKFTKGVVVFGKKPIFKLKRKIKVTMNDNQRDARIKVFAQNFRNPISNFKEFNQLIKTETGRGTTKKRVAQLLGFK